MTRKGREQGFVRDGHRLYGGGKKKLLVYISISCRIDSWVCDANTDEGGKMAHIGRELKRCHNPGGKGRLCLGDTLITPDPFSSTNVTGGLLAFPTRLFPHSDIPISLL